MGIIQHHAIIVTDSNTGRLEKAFREAVSIGLKPTGRVPDEEPLNNYRSIFIPPDGSKEGWPESVEGDTKRHKFKMWCMSQDIRWIEVEYGELGLGIRSGGMP